MAHRNGNILVKDWRSVLHDRIDLYRDVSLGGDTATANMILVNERLAAEDYYLTAMDIATRQHPSTLWKITRSMKDLEVLAEGGAEDTQKTYNEAHKDMEQFKTTEAGKTSDGWKNLLHTSIDQRRKETNDMWDRLEESGIRTIESMPEDMRDPAARTYGGALGGVMSFITSGIKWLTNAWNSVVEWFKKLVENIKAWFQSVGSWFSSAWQTVKSWFGGKRYSALGTEPPAERLASPSRVASSSGSADHQHPATVTAG